MSSSSSQSPSPSSSSSLLNPSARTYVPLPRKATTRTFPQMLNLQEELILYILSFVSDVPYESSSDANESTLTNIIPLVCKKFYFQYSTSDYLWKGALIRLVAKEPQLWGHGVESFITSHTVTHTNMDINTNSNEDDDGNNNNNNNDNNNHLSNDLGDGGTVTDDGSILTSAIRLVTDGGRCMDQILQTHPGYFANRYNNGNHNQNHNTQQTINNTARPVFCELYRYVLSNNIRFTSPLFYMPDNVQLGNEFGLHFFEPRYRLLIADVMAPYPNHVNGRPIRIKSNNGSAHDDNIDSDDSDDDNFELPSSYPRFIYANKSPLKRGTTACIVQVKQCVIHANATADVYLNPVSYAKIEHVWVRPHSHNLYEARVMMLNRQETKDVIDQSRAMPYWPHPSGGAGNYGGNGDADDDDNDDDDDDNNNNGNDNYINSMLFQIMEAANRETNGHGDVNR